MGIQINGNNDIISALDGSWTAEGAYLNTSGIATATTFKGNIIGTAATFTGPVTIGGTLTYEDVTNIDSVGVVTARDGVHITGDNKYLKIGAGGDLQFVHTGSETFIANTTGHLTRRSDVHKWQNYAGSSEYVRFTSTGVGIGTNTPIGKLHLNYNGNNGISFRMENFEGSTTFHNDSGALHIDSGFHLFRNENGSSEFLRIASDGAVGINETSPTGKLTITQDPQGFVDDSAQPQATFLIKHGTSGSNRRWIGIGASLTGAWLQSSSPGGTGLAAPFWINKGGGDVTLGNDKLKVAHSGGIVWIGSFTQYGNSAFNASNGGIVATSSGQNTLKLIDSTAQAADVGARILLGGQYRSSGDASPFVELKSLKENGTDNNYAYGFKVSTTPNGGSLSERLRINSSGEVGIGVVAASGNQLHIKNGGTADAFAKIESESGYDAALLLDTSNGGGASADVRFQMDGSTKGSIQYVNNASSADVNSMLFRTGNNSTKMQITTGGNVNIGGNYTQTNAPLCVTTSANDYGIRLMTGSNVVTEILNNDSAGNCEIRGYYNNNSGTRGEGFRLESSGNSYFMGGRLLVGTTAHSISSSEMFEVKHATTGFSYFENDNTSGYAPIYINNKGANSGFAPIITITDGGGNRAGLGLDNSEWLRITGQSGVEMYTGGTHGGGTQKWRLNNLGDLTHTFSGRHGQMIGSTDGSGAYILLDGAEGDPLSSGTDYMYMEHTSTGQFEMWNGNGSVSTTKFMDVSPAGYIKEPKQPSFAAYRAQSSWAVGSGDEMVFNNTRHNTGSHYSTSTGRFTAPVSGSYLFTFFIIFTGNYSSAYVRMFKNGARQYGSDTHFTHADNSSNWHNVSFSQIFYLAANDYVSIYNGNPGVTYHGNHWMQFCGYLLG